MIPEEAWFARPELAIKPRVFKTPDSGWAVKLPPKNGGPRSPLVVTGMTWEAAFKRGYDHASDMLARQAFGY